jgi:hypothetical protein
LSTAASTGSQRKGEGKSGRRKTTNRSEAGDVPRHDTPPSAPPLPSLASESVLPLVAVGSVAFERLCRDILRIQFPDISGIALKRTSGARQFGVDVEGFNSEHHPAVVISAKCYKEVKSRYIKAWINDFTSHLDTHWKGKKIEHFVLALSHECNDDAINDEFRKHSEPLRHRGIQPHLWNAFDITELLRRDSAKIARYFHEVWVGAISATSTLPNPGTQPTVSKGQSGSMLAQANGQIATLSQELDQAVQSRLNEATVDLRAGRPSRLKACLTDLLEKNPAFDALSYESIARLHRLRATLCLHENDIDGARDSFRQANEYETAPDRVGSALIARFEGTAEDGMRALGTPISIREIEIFASWLLETGDVPAAHDQLKTVAVTNTTAEILRLRAICEFLEGHRTRALRTAKSSVAKEPSAALPRLTLGAIHVMLALPPSVEPQLGLSPNPIDRALVMPTEDAQQHLLEALSHFEQLAGQVEAPLLTDVEVWRLASLLLNDSRRPQARLVARGLLRKDAPDPTAVAWALQHGISVRTGHLKKHFKDRLRGGLGNPSDVAVLALLTAYKDGADAGLQIVETYASGFPEAAQFFDLWRANFGVDNGENTFPVIVAQAIRDGDFTKLVEQINSGHCNASEVLSGAEVLARNRAWSDLNSVRSALQELSIERAIALAAIAAKEVGTPDDGVAIIQTFEGQYGTEGLPRNLRHLLAQCHEAAGALGPAIAELSAMAAGGKDLAAQRHLIGTYLRIGDLGKIRPELERLIGQGDAEAEDLLALASAIRTEFPETARKAIKHLGARKQEFEPMIASNLLTLALDLGVSDVHERMLPLVINSANTDGSVVRKFSEKELFQFIDEQTDQAKKKLSSWARGHTPGAVSFDIETFARIFLDSYAAQRGDERPSAMLVRSGANDISRLPAAQESRRLRIDLSAFLLASRFDLLQVIDDFFEIELPPSLPEAILEIEAKFHPHDELACLACIRALDGKYGGVRYFDETTDTDFLSLLKEDSFDADADSMATVVARCYAEGTVDRERFKLWCPGKLEADVSQNIAIDRPLVLTKHALWLLAQQGLLEAVWKVWEPAIVKEDAERLRIEITHAQADAEIRTLLTSSRKLVSEHIQAGRWKFTTRGRSSDRNPDYDKLPAHTRCLLETLENLPNDCLFWIEDRRISHQPAANAVDVFSVLEMAASGAFLTDHQHRQLFNNIRDSGYTFCPIRLDWITADIDSAPVRDGRLVETPDLRGWRRWFAGECGRLDHLDLTANHNAEGRVAGEARRALAMINACREVLAHIWATQSSIAAKVARSNWAWRSFRLDHFPYANDTDNQEIWINQRAMVLAHVLDLPFLEGPEEDEEAIQRHKDFLSWFIAHVVDPMAIASPALGDAVSDRLSDLLVRSLDVSSSFAPEDQNAIQQLYLQNMRYYLAILPDEWSDRVGSDPELRKVAGIQRSTVLTMSGGITVGARDLCKATADVLDQPSSAQKTGELPLSDGRLAKLTFEPDTSVGNIRIVHGDQDISLDPLTTALAHPDAAMRLSAVFDWPEDTRAGFSTDFWKTVLAIEDPEVRFSRAGSVVNGQLHYRLGRLASKIRRQAPASLSEIELPEPEVICSYLGFGQHMPSSVEDIEKRSREVWSNRAGYDFSTRLGIFSALFSFQVELDDEAQLGSAGNGLFVSVQDLIFCSQSTEANRAIDEILDALERGDGALFASLVRYASHQAAVSSKWQNLDPELRVAMLWFYAGAILSAFSTRQAHSQDITRFIDEHIPNRLLLSLRHQQHQDWEVRLTTELDPQDFVGCIAMVCSGRANFSPPQIDKFQAQLGAKGENGWLPSPRLLFSPPVGPPNLLPARDFMPSLSALGWIEEQSVFNVRENERIVLDMLAATESQPEHTSLPPIATFADINLLAEDDLKRLLGALAASIPSRTFGASTMGTHMLLCLFARVSATLNDSHYFQNIVEHHARHCAAKWPGKVLPYEAHTDEGSAAFSILSDAIVEHIRHLDLEDEERLCIAGLTLEKISAVWQGALHASIGVADMFATHSSVKGSNGIRPSLMRLRAA